jgi:hypothetical protein
MPHEYKDISPKAVDDEATITLEEAVIEAYILLPL